MRKYQKKNPVKIQTFQRDYRLRTYDRDDALQNLKTEASRICLFLKSEVFYFRPGTIIIVVRETNSNKKLIYYEWLLTQ